MPNKAVFEPTSDVQITNVDAILGGSMAEKLWLHNLDMTAALRTNARVNRVMGMRNDALPTDFWKSMDTAMHRAGIDRLPFVEMLRRRGLRYPLANPLATKTLTWQQVSQMQRASVTMTPNTATNRDALDFVEVALPIPMIIKEFGFDIRDFEAMRILGRALDTSHVEEAIRMVNEEVEIMHVTGASLYANDSGIIYGLEDAPNKQTGSLAAAWTASDADPLADVLAMIQKAVNYKYPGPYALCVNRGYAAALGDDYKAAVRGSVRSRIMELDEIAEIVVVDKMTAGKVALVQLTNNVCEVVDGFQPRIFEWESRGGMAFNFAVVACQVPRFRTDYNSKSGVVIYSA